MTDSSRTDLCIVGAGPLGVALARHARSLGADVVLVDRGAAEATEGGALSLKLAALQVAGARALAQRQGLSLGLGGSEPKISHRGIQEWASELARWWSAADAPSTLVASGIQILSGETRFVDARSIAVGDTVLRPRVVVLATGGRPLLPSVPGLDEVDYLTPERLADNARKLTHLLVVGGSPAAVSLAQTHRRLGSQVTLVPQGELLTGFDREAVTILERVLADEGVRILAGGQLSQIVPRSQGTGAVVVGGDGVEQNLDVSHVLVAVGRSADLEALDPAAARLRPLRGGGYVSGPLGQTSSRFVRVTGDAAGIEPWHRALAHGRAVIDQLVLGLARSPGPGPDLVLTDPQLVQVGRVPQGTDLPRGGQQMVRVNVAEHPGVRLAGHQTGLAKAYVDARGRVLGATLLAPDAAEAGAMLALLQDRGISLADLGEVVAPFPSLMSILCDLSDVYRSGRPVSPWTERLRRFRRLLPW